MFDLLKMRFPALYEEYLHLQRLKQIRDTEKMKKLPLQEQKAMILKMYEEKIGRSFDWSNLHTYTEKMQWEKIENKDPRKSILADKHAVREWVSKKIGNEYLIPEFGVWDSFDDIDFKFLPNQFVLKTNHGTGTNYIVKDSKTFNKRDARRKFNDWMRMDFGYFNGFETHYSKIKPQIIAEKYLETELGELQDYKFLCFGGTPYFCWVDMGRYSTHTRNVYDLEWNLQPWNQATYGICKNPIPQPPNFEKMVKLATVLCQGFAQVRVDLYNIDGTIYFGEMTFTNGRGFDRIIPEEYDLMLGDLWEIDMKEK